VRVQSVGFIAIYFFCWRVLDLSFLAFRIFIFFACATTACVFFLSTTN